MTDVHQFDHKVIRPTTRIWPDQPLFIASLIGWTNDDGLNLQHEAAIFSAEDLDDARIYAQILCEQRFPGQNHAVAIANLPDNARLTTADQQPWSWPQ
jgi:hypothetical protein